MPPRLRGSAYLASFCYAASLRAPFVRRRLPFFNFVKRTTELSPTASDRPRAAFRASAGGALSVVAAFAAPHAAHSAGADLASIKLTAVQPVLRADGKSTTYIIAEVRDARGGVAPDGTRVRFETTKGRLDTQVATTQNGVARVILTASDLPESALIQANLESVGQAVPSQITVTFTADAESVEAGSNWAQITARNYVGYAVDNGIVQASGTNGGAKLVYRSFTITADTIQINVRENSLRAQGNVTLSQGKETRRYRNLDFLFLQGQGKGERDDENGKLQLVGIRSPGLSEAPLYIAPKLTPTEILRTLPPSALPPGALPGSAPVPTEVPAAPANGPAAPSDTPSSPAAPANPVLGPPAPREDGPLTPNKGGTREPTNADTIFVSKVPPLLGVRGPLISSLLGAGVAVSPAVVPAPPSTTPPPTDPAQATAAEQAALDATAALQAAKKAEEEAGDPWAMADLSGSSVTIVAKSISMEPNGRIQFRRATFYLDGKKTLSLPFHVMQPGQDTLFSEQIVGVGSNGPTFDLPFYYDVRPSAIGTFHVRRGSRVGGNAYSVRPGWSLDLDQQYNGANGVNGAVQVTGVSRQDWGARLSHSQRLGTGTQANFFVDFPNHQDLFGTSQISRAFSGFTVNAVASGSVAKGSFDPLSGLRYGSGSDLRTQVYAETNPRAAGLSGQLKYTLSAGTARQTYYGNNALAKGAILTNNAGLRLFTSPLALMSHTTLNSSLSLGQSWIGGRDASRIGRSGASILGSLSLRRSLSPTQSIGFSYDYTQTPLFSQSIAPGHHRVGLTGSLNRGEKWDLTFTAAQTLDRPQTILFSNLNFGITGPWRGGVSLQSSKFSGYQYKEIQYALIRRIAGRDFAVYYSTTSRRFQLDLSGARF